MTRKSIVAAYIILLQFLPSSTLLPPEIKQESLVFLLYSLKRDQGKIEVKIQQPLPVKYQLSIDRMYLEGLGQALMGLFSLLVVLFLKEGSQSMVVSVNI